jgi:YggT family protein
MTIERREEHTEVVSYNAADVGPGDMRTPTPTTVYETETTTSHPSAVRRTQVFTIQQVIYLLFGLLEGLLGIRFVLGLLGANPGAGFAQFIYGITSPFLAPFVGLFGEPRFEGMIFEWNALVAILVYAMLAGLLVKVLTIVLGNRQSDTHTTTSSRIDNR